MKLPSLGVVALALFLHALPSIAAPHLTKMVESEPVEAGGLEFIVAAELEWVCFNPPRGEDPVQIQLFIRNVSDAPQLFQVNDTFGIKIKDPYGEPVIPRGGRDMSLRIKSVLIPPGGRFCLSRKADLHWNEDGKTRSLVYYDGTGSWATFGPLSTGSYTLSFWCKQAKAGPKDAPASSWVGDIDTKEITFKVVDP